MRSPMAESLTETFESSLREEIWRIASRYSATKASHSSRRATSSPSRTDRAHHDEFLGERQRRRDDILNCIRRVHAGETFVPVSLAAKLAERISGADLTEREMTVLRTLAKGQSNKQIGRSLFISETTVKAHLKSIFSKMNVLSRTEAIAAAARRGIVQL